LLCNGVDDFYCFFVHNVACIEFFSCLVVGLLSCLIICQ